MARTRLRTRPRYGLRTAGCFVAVPAVPLPIPAVGHLAARRPPESLGKDALCPQRPGLFTRGVFVSTVPTRQPIEIPGPPPRPRCHPHSGTGAPSCPAVRRTLQMGDCKRASGGAFSCATRAQAKSPATAGWAGLRRDRLGSVTRDSLPADGSSSEVGSGEFVSRRCALVTRRAHQSHVTPRLPWPPARQQPPTPASK